ncbi:MAG: dihydroorotate dehydrogenase electron transfer subunit [Clostridiales Family XIII bacterium]|jgi:dihydroorotate dehydrogenase electron transfer subunit|nr:dihydroorotate dehydrogenase electron transfer subunit [Clostridiales Family XIII bacterium]
MNQEILKGAAMAEWVSGNQSVRIIENKEIASGIYSLKLNAPEIAAASSSGQFINLYLENGLNLLPRPISIADADAGKGIVTLVFAVVGSGTEIIAGFKEGKIVRVLGPLGKGYDLEFAAGRSVLLVGGGLGIPPLAYAARGLNALPDTKVTAILGYRDDAFYSNEFKDFTDAVYAISETDGAVDIKFGQTGNVIDLLDHIDKNNAMIFSCGPAPMLKAVYDWADARGIPTQLSLEARMGCGYGVCVGCTVRIREKSGAIIRRKVCAAGPVFKGDELVWK